MLRGRVEEDALNARLAVVTLRAAEGDHDPAGACRGQLGDGADRGRRQRLFVERGIDDHRLQVPVRRPQEGVARHLRARGSGGAPPVDGVHPLLDHAGNQRSERSSGVVRVLVCQTRAPSMTQMSVSVPPENPRMPAPAAPRSPLPRSERETRRSAAGHALLVLLFTKHRMRDGGRASQTSPLADHHPVGEGAQANMASQARTRVSRVLFRARRRNRAAECSRLIQ